LRGNAYGGLAIALYNEIHRECSFEEATCDGSKIMWCSTDGRWEYSKIDCSLTNQVCHEESPTNAVCLTRAEADEFLGVDLDTIEPVWTLEDAVNYIQGLNEEEKYSDHKEFIDGLCDEGILTEKECKKIIGEKAWGGVVNVEKDMAYVKKLLLEKQSKQSKQDEKEASAFEELIQKFEEQKDKWGWNNWEEVENSLKTSIIWNNVEKNMVLNAESCADCGKGIGLCNEAECIAIGFKLRDEEGLNNMCVHTGLWGCTEVIVGEETSSSLELGDLNIPSGETCPAPPEVTPNIQAISTPNAKVLEKIKELAGTPVTKDLDADSNQITNCFDPPKYIYDSAGVEADCVYSDRVGKEYGVFGTIIKTDSAFEEPYPSFAVNERSCFILDKSGSDKLALIDKGYLLSYAYDNKQGHSVIFVEWDPAPPMAKVFGWKRFGTGHIFDYSIVNLSDDAHPVYMAWEPKLKSFGGGSFGGGGAGEEY